MAGITDLVYTDQSKENCIEQKHSTQDMTDHIQYKHIILFLHVYYKSCTCLYKVISSETMVRVLFKSQGARMKQRKLRQKQQTKKQNKTKRKHIKN